MKMSETEPIVRHAVLSLSSLHEYMSARRPARQDMDPTMIFKEYSKSIQALKAWKAEDGNAVPLVASILFTCIEFLLDHEAGAKMHIIQGRKLLENLVHSGRAELSLVKTHLVPMYTRLGIASYLFGSMSPAVPDELKTFASPPSRFNTLDEARTSLYTLFDEVLRFGAVVEPRIFEGSASPLELNILGAKQQKYLSYLDQWYAAFTALMSTQKSNHSLSTTISLMQIYFHGAYVWVATALSPYQLEYDQHTAAFASIIGHASTIVNTSHRGSNLQAFSFETEIVAPLYWAAIKCRHPQLRRAAVRLLMRDELKGRRENMWHANESIVIATRVIAMEENDRIDSDSAPSPASSTDKSSGRDSTPSSSNRGFEYQVPYRRPPTIPQDEVRSFFPSHPPASSGVNGFNHDYEKPEPPSSLPGAERILNTINWDRLSTEPPFGVPESRRIKNTIIGDQEKGGVWVTLFRDPLPGEDQWDIHKVFLKFDA